MGESDRIMRLAIVGYVVTGDKNKRGVLYTRPLTVSWTEDWTEYNVDVDEDEAVIGIVPALPGQFRVLGAIQKPEGWWEHLDLGYEFPGAFHPDWDKELDEKIEQRKQEEKIKEKKA